MSVTFHCAKANQLDQTDAILSELAQRFDLVADLRPFHRLAAGDPLLEPVEKRWRGMRVSTRYSLYEYLVITTVLQNTSVARSTSMLQTLFGRYGSRVCFDGQDLAAFWAPESLADEDIEAELRSLKLGYRAKTLNRVAREFAAGLGPDIGQLRKEDRNEASLQLRSIFGVGPASVWYLLFEVLHHYDAFDTISPWERKIYARLLFDRDDEDGSVILEEVRRRWGAWRMLASHYLFEDLFTRHREKPIPWLKDLIRLPA